MSTTESLPARTVEALKEAVQYAYECQFDDDHWLGETQSNPIFTAEYLFLRQALKLDFTQDEKDAFIRWFLLQQNEDGSYGLAPAYPGDPSTTTESYLSLKMLGYPTDKPEMVRAREYMLRTDGMKNVRIFTRFFLATFGLWPWDYIPQLPLELMLAPKSSPVNIYTLSSWARATSIPLLIVRHHQPIYSLPNGTHKVNNYLDELWNDPSNKKIPYAPSLWQMIGKEDLTTIAFTAADKVCSIFGGFRKFPGRRYLCRLVVDWLVMHQESSGDWGGYWPPQHGTILALVIEGFPLNHPVIRSGMEAAERYAMHDKNGRRYQATTCAIWDTAIMTVALGDCGLIRPDNVRLTNTVRWLLERQCKGTEGDWRIYRPELPTGGWAFQNVDNWYPDVDDTAIVILGLLKNYPTSINSEHIILGINWIVGMQNSDGGWAAFDWNNDKLFLNKIPFGDMDSLCDPATADVTGRLVECLGHVLCSPHAHTVDRELLRKVEVAAQRGIKWLLDNQEPFGGWWGRWGVNYVYGTSNVLSGLHYFMHKGDEKLDHAISRAVEWVKSVQIEDGGWGEGLESYDDPAMAGKGIPSTATQTAWSIMSLIPYVPASDPAVTRGVEFLVRFQTLLGSDPADNRGKTGQKGKSWPEVYYTGTGFPGCLYLQYTLNPHFWPMIALGRYLRKAKGVGLTGLFEDELEDMAEPVVQARLVGEKAAGFGVIDEKGGITIEIESQTSDSSDV